MTYALYVLLVAAVVVVIPTSFCVFAVAQRDRWPLVCALSMLAVLGLQYCSMKALP